MNLQKHEHEALSAVRCLCRGIVVELQPAGKHSKLIARLAEKQVQVTVSSSPACAQHVASLTVRQVRRRFREIGAKIE